MTYDHERAMARAEAAYLTPPDDDHIKGCPCHEDSEAPEDGSEPECECEKIKKEAKERAAEERYERRREDGE